MPDLATAEPQIDYRTEPSRYRHWKLSFDGPVATLGMDVAESGGLRPGYALKLNSYDLGVDIELADALQRIRFEHPEVRVVVLTSLKDRVFCSGANIFMLGQSSHAAKVNFCKFTNETRNGIEDTSQHSGLKFLAAVNGACAGGGYELALACDEIMLIDDRSSAVSLPEVPLLGVLPGTGGLTRLTDKRRVRPDRADIFCTMAEGVRGERAKDWGLVDAIAKPAQFVVAVRERALALAAQSDRPADAKGVALLSLERKATSDNVEYRYVTIAIDRPGRVARLAVRGPSDMPGDLAAIMAAGGSWWPLAMARELDDAILWLRSNEPEIGTWLLATQGDPASVLAVDATLAAHGSNWFVRETTGLLRRTLARLEVSSRSLFALVERGSCFAGTLLELALAADRIYMQRLPNDPDEEPRLALSPLNFGAYPAVDGRTRLMRRFARAEEHEAFRPLVGEQIDAARAEALGLVTASPDDLDWDDEIRIAIEERASLSPDALTGMEANLRFGGAETMATRIFGRLTAWQNWVFSRPSAVGDKGVLRVYGTGEKPAIDWRRV